MHEMQMESLVVVQLTGARAETTTPGVELYKFLGLFSFCRIQLFFKSAQTFSLTKWNDHGNFTI